MQFLHLSAYTTRKKDRKRAIFQKPFYHIKIYLTCDLTTKYQVISPINGRETKEKRKKQTENVQFVPRCTTPECLYHAQKRSKTCNFPKPFKHIKIYLECGLFTKYQVIPPINGRETKKKRKKKAENVQFWLSAPLLSAYTTRKKGRKREISQKPFKHIKIYLECGIFTKYQVIPPINGRETKEKR